MSSSTTPGAAASCGYANTDNKYLDSHGIRRFRENAIVSWLLEFSRERGVGLNELALMDFKDDDWQQFAQLIGYSVGGYGELSFVSDEALDMVEDEIAKHGTHD